MRRSDLEIADMLAEHRRMKNLVKQIRAEMIELAVNEFGMEQQDAINMDLAAFFDGYLVAKGMQQSWRNNPQGSAATTGANS